jgi:hypothetical protein
MHPLVTGNPDENGIMQALDMELQAMLDLMKDPFNLHQE